MKTLISLLALVAIVYAYVLSANLYLQGNLLCAYPVIIAAIGSIVFWIHKFGQDLQKQQA
jgi:hypothetical protein